MTPYNYFIEEDYIKHRDENKYTAFAKLPGFDYETGVECIAVSLKPDLILYSYRDLEDEAINQLAQFISCCE